MGHKIKDLTQFPPGRFGRLTPLREVGTNGRGSALWECRCSCGNKITACSSALVRGQQSCGCVRKEKSERKRAVVEEMIFLGKSVGEVAAHLGVSKQAVCQVLYRGGRKVKDIRHSLSGGSNRHIWTPEEISLLGTIPDRRLADQLRLSSTAVGSKRRELGIPLFQNPPRITPGQRVHRLTAETRVLREMPSGKLVAHWWCKCECGTSCLVAESNLVGRKQQSCGCRQKEWMSELGKRNKKRRESE